MAKRGDRPNAERDAEIVRLRRAGHTLRHVADDFGLSQERVRQIQAQQDRRELRRRDIFEAAAC